LTELPPSCIVPMHMATSQAMIELEGVVRRFRTGEGVAITALDHVSFSVPEGAAVAVSGPSGSGKSTLLHLIGALDHPDEGAIRVAGTDLARLRSRELAAHRRRVGPAHARGHHVGRRHSRRRRRIPLRSRDPHRRRSPTRRHRRAVRRQPAGHPRPALARGTPLRAVHAADDSIAAGRPSGS